MRKVYFAISFLDRKLFDKEIEIFVQKAKEVEIKILVFVDQYHFADDQEKEMMQIAFQSIDDSDLLIAELSNKSIGVGIELGYAYAQNKPIIYLRKEGSPYSTTTAGCANYSIVYTDAEDMHKKVLALLTQLLK
jgi:nucleoside 2-deoxyribosyltransferase